jgi:hypothetical protein
MTTGQTKIFAQHRRGERPGQRPCSRQAAGGATRSRRAARGPADQAEGRSVSRSSRRGEAPLVLKRDHVRDGVLIRVGVKLTGGRAARGDGLGVAHTRRTRWHCRGEAGAVPLILGVGVHGWAGMGAVKDARGRCRPDRHRLTLIVGVGGVPVRLHRLEHGLTDADGVPAALGRPDLGSQPSGTGGAS